MKKIFILTVIMMMIAAVTAVQAEVTAESVSVTPFAGGYVFEGNEYQKSSYTVGLRAGYNITENIGVEGYFHYVPTELQGVPDEPWQNVYGYGVEGLYHFFPESRFVPFVAVGVGFVHYGYPEPYRTTKFALEYGGGLKYFLPGNVANFFFADNIALRADVRHVIPFNERYNDLLCTFGIEFSFSLKKKEVVVPRTQEPTSQKEVIAPKAEASAPVEEVVAKAEAPAPAPVEEVAPQAQAPAPVATAPAGVAVAPVVTGNSDQVSSKQNEIKSIPEEDIKNLVTKWLISWRSGDMRTYRSCYASNFESKGKDLNGWISYKTSVRQKSKNININIDDLRISVYVNGATAVFTQSYSSSILKDKGKKTLELRKENDEWKIYKEIM